MKKLSKFALSMVSTVALLGSALFTSCIQTYADLEVGLKPAFIIGGVTADANVEGQVDLWSTRAVPLTYDENGIATYEFEYTDNCATCWGNGATKSSFKLLLDDTGATNWGMGAVLEEGEEKEQSCPASDNTILENLVVGNKYKITIIAKGATVTAKYEMTSGSVAAQYMFASGSDLGFMTFDGKDTYTYDFIASAETQKISVYSDGKYLKGTGITNSAKEVEATESKENLELTGLKEGGSYILTVKIEENKTTVKVTLGSLWIVGGLKPDNEFTELNLTSEDNVYSFEYTYTGKTSWGEEGNTVAFLITAKKGEWNKLFKDKKFAVNEEYVESGSEDNNNAVVTGLEKDKTYIFYIKVDGDKYFAKVVAK